MNQDSQTTKTYKHNIIKKFGHLLGAKGLRDILQWSLFIFMARKFSLSTFGDISIAITTGEMMRFIARCGFDQHLTTQLARKSDTPTNLVMHFSIMKGIILFFVWLGMIGFMFWQNYDTQLKLLVIFLGTGIAVETIVSSFFVVLQVLGRQDVEARVRVMGAAGGFGYGLLTLLTGFSPLVVCFFAFIENIVNFWGASRAFVKRAKFRIDFQQLKKVWDIWKDGFIFTLMALMAVFYNKANLYFLKSYVDSDAAGVYMPAWSTVEGVSALISGMLLGRVMFPIFSKLWKRDKDEFSKLGRDTCKWLLAGSIIVTYALAIESDRIIGLIYGSEKFADAIWMQQILTLSITTAFIHNLAAYMMISSGTLRLLLTFYISGFLFNLFYCTFLIPINPLAEACWAIVYTKLLVALGTVTYSQVRFKFIPLLPLIQLIGACILGVGIYYACQAFLFRELTEVLAILPVLYLAWGWRKEWEANKARVE